MTEKWLWEPVRETGTFYDRTGSHAECGGVSMCSHPATLCYIDLGPGRKIMSEKGGNHRMTQGKSIRTLLEQALAGKRVGVSEGSLSVRPQRRGTGLLVGCPL